MTDSYEQLRNLTPEQRALLLMRLKKQKEQATNEGDNTITRQPRESNVFPLSFAQQRIWFLDQLEKDSIEYNIPMAFSLVGYLDEKALKKSINDLIKRHESLRTTFKIIGSEPTQVIAPLLTLPINKIDLTFLSGDKQKDKLKQLADEEANTPFDLAEGPLVRVVLLQLGKDEHALLITTHHIVFDGWSTGIFYNDLSRLYEANLENTDALLSVLDIQYADFSCWENRLLKSNQLIKQLNYWKERLNGAPPELGLPIDRPRSYQGKIRACAETFNIDSELINKIKGLSTQTGATMFTVLFSAFALLLSRYSRHLDIVSGLPVAGRNHKELERLIGMFVNTIVLRVDLSEAPNFLQLMDRVREAAQEGIDNQDIPFQKLVEETQPKRNLSYSPIFQVMFNLLSASNDGLSLKGMEVSPLKLRNVVPGTKYDLTFTLKEENGGIKGLAEYNADIYNPSTITRMTGNFITLLEGCVAHPEQRIDTIPILSPKEKQQILVEWNNSEFLYDKDRYLHEVFEIQAELKPDAVAAYFGKEKITYRELNTRANQLAHLLVQKGVGPECFVGICLTRSLNMIVSVLGVLKSGGVYVPLDPNYPAERLAFIMDDTGLQTILTEQTLRDRIPKSVVHLITLDSDENLLASQRKDNPVNTASSTSGTYVIYTSGSTGKPKGVQIIHRGAVSLVFAMRELLSLTQKDRFLAISSLSFDMSVIEFFVPLSLGGSLVLARDEDLNNPEELIAYLQTAGITAMLATPSTWRLIQEAGWTGNASVRILCGGDALTGNIADQLLGKGQSLWNLYGPTEITVCATGNEITEKNSRITIGKPIPNTRTYILDKYDNPVPIGVAGELCVGGEGVARGYLNRAELTAEKFVADPFSQEPDARMYRTGDLVRYLADGSIEFIGRIDNQVKIRGYRIELGEIESVLHQHTNVRECVVVPRKDASGTDTLIAYVVTEPDQSVEPGDLAQFLKNFLPHFMIPSFFQFISAVPLTSTGKVDSKALPDLDTAGHTQDRPFIAPRTPLEESITEIWSELLGIDQVGVHDDFFDLGGHSLLATQVMSRIRDVFQQNLPLRVLFDAPTISELAEALEGGSQEQEESIQKCERTDELPLSFSQQKLWFLEQFAPGKPTYNIPVTLRLKGELSIPILEKALNKIIERHEVLRTCFPKQDGKPIQQTRASIPFSIKITDLSDLPDANREEQCRERATHEARIPFDLAQDPLIRARVFHLDRNDHVLVLSTHHIVSDGWSSGRLMQELGVIYHAFLEDKPCPLDELPIQYADFTLFQREWFDGPVMETQKAYWKQQLSGIPTALELPTDYARPAILSDRGDREFMTIPSALTEKLQGLSKENGVTLFMTLLAGFQILLYRYTNQEDIVVGTPVANRNRKEIEPLIGFFVNTLVLRLSLADNPSFMDLLARVKEMAIGAFTHQDIPFEQLVEELSPERSLNHTPLFQVMFSYEHAQPQSLKLPGLETTAFSTHGTGTSKYDLTLSINRTAQDLQARLEYNAGLFQAVTIRRMLSHYLALLESVAGDPQQTVPHISFLSPDEKQDLLVNWNQTDSPFPQDKTLHRLVVEQMRRTPDTIAAQFGEDTLTYQELDRLSTALANQLRAAGAGPDVLVGVFLNRSLDMLIAVLGVLRAGAAYLPLDPDYPRERLVFMVEDAGVKITLTQEDRLQDLPVQTPEVICIERIQDDQDDETDNARIDTQISPQNLAYVIYTSGSTGKPKGVQIPHQAVVNFLSTMKERPGLMQDDVLLSVTSLSFDIAVLELFLPLTVGAKVVMASREEIYDGKRLLSRLKSSGANVMQATPATWRLLVDGGWEQDLPIKVLVGGEVLAEDLAKQLLERSPSVWNMYGPTETTVWSAIYRVDPDRLNSIGKPIANTQFFVLDSNLLPVPVGVPGELHIGGAGLARGYLNRPDLTNDRFIANPFDQGRTRLYKTGDLVRYQTDGSLEYLSRMDNQVKIRGFRIELGEIETVLNSHEAIKECAVITYDDKQENKNIGAYFVSPSSVSTLSLRNHLRKHLPDYMIPNMFVQLDALPLTPNGKVDRKTLAAQSHGTQVSQTQFQAPETPIQKEIAEIWRSVLEVDRVGLGDNFFDLGGYSLLIMQVNSLVEDKLDTTIPVRDFFVQTMGQIASYCEKNSTTSTMN